MVWAGLWAGGWVVGWAVGWAVGRAVGWAAGMWLLRGRWWLGSGWLAAVPFFFLGLFFSPDPRVFFFQVSSLITSHYL